MADVLKEDGGSIVLEDGSGNLILEADDDPGGDSTGGITAIAHITSIGSIS